MPMRKLIGKTMLHKVYAGQGNHILRNITRWIILTGTCASSPCPLSDSYSRSLLFASAEQFWAVHGQSRTASTMEILRGLIKHGAAPQQVCTVQIDRYKKLTARLRSVIARNCYRGRRGLLLFVVKLLWLVRYALSKKTVVAANYSGKQSSS